jgi:hypothetical protein
VDVHGGLNFGEPDYHCGGKGGKDDAWWVGFDCGHVSYDRPDPDLPNGQRAVDLFNDLLILPGKYATIKTTEYVIEQCRRLCDQAAQLAAS